jgi:uncharacterized protein (DUF1501 family)
MAITRRQFLQRSGVATAGTLLGSSFFGNPFLRSALADTIGDRYLVVVYLDGGNDGTNTVVPVDNGGGTLRDDYDVARTTINLSPTDLANTLIGTDPNTGAQLALHPGFLGFAGRPGFGGFKSLWDDGNLAVIQGCGYPEYNLSHDNSRAIWQTGDPLGVNPTTGWIGRFLADPSEGYAASDIPAVSISDRLVGEFRQSATSVLAVQRLGNFGFPYDPSYINAPNDDRPAKRAAFLDLCANAAANAQPVIQAIGTSGGVTLTSSENFPQAGTAYDADPARQIFADLYDDGAGGGVGQGLARDLREVAKIIYGVDKGIYSGVNARFFQVTNTGYDTHSDQGAAGPTDQHFRLHAELAASIKVFFDDVADMLGDENKLCVLVWSEFGRRIKQNRNGTDHGSQGPMFVIGGSAPGSVFQGGVYGNHPNLAKTSWDDEGNSEYRQDANGGVRSTDFRDVYGTVFQHWLNMPSGIIVPGVFPLDPGPAATYWTVPNLDMGFVA